MELHGARVYDVWYGHMYRVQPGQWCVRTVHLDCEDFLPDWQVNRHSHSNLNHAKPKSNSTK